MWTRWKSFLDTDKRFPVSGFQFGRRKPGTGNQKLPFSLAVLISLLLFVAFLAQADQSFDQIRIGEP
jgi:hypothetical protein